MTHLKTILLIDDDDDLREVLTEQFLMTEEFMVDEANSGVAALDQVKNHSFDLLVLDVGLPDTDGRELCRLMRKQGLKSPIIMLTGHTSDADAILGLDSGANDYVTKPFKFPVLLARVRAQLRQHEHSEDAVFKLGPYLFRPATKSLVTEDNTKILLTEKETNILNVQLVIYREDLVKLNLMIIIKLKYKGIFRRIPMIKWQVFIIQGWIQRVYISDPWYFSVKIVHPQIYSVHHSRLEVNQKDDCFVFFK